MTKKSYADVLKWAVKIQLDSAKEDWENGGYENEYLEGIIRGLEIALEKIDASMFLCGEEG